MRPRLLSLLFVSVAVLSPVSGWAQTAPAAPAGDVVQLSLEDAVALGRQRSFRLKRSLRNTELAEIRYDTAEGVARPRFDLNYNALQSSTAFSADTPQFKTSTGPTARFQTGLTASASMPVDVSGAIRRQIEQARLAADGPELDFSQAVLDVTTDIRVNYIEGLRSQGVVQADGAVVEALERLLGRLGPERSQLAGFVQTELANARQTLEASRTNADLSQSNLKQLLRLPPEARLGLTTRLDEATPSVDRDALLERALDNRFDVKQAQLRLKQAELAARQAGDYRKPSVYLSGYYNASLTGADNPFGDLTDRYSNGGASLSLNVPLATWDNHQLANAKRTARLQADQARDDIDEQRERIAVEIRQALIGLDRAEQRLRTLPSESQARQALDASEAALLSASGETAQFLLPQVSNARAAWRSAQTARIDALADYYSAYYRLQRAIAADPSPGA